MNKKTIFNVYVELNNDYDLFLRLINACKEAGLKATLDNNLRKILVFRFSFVFEEFSCWSKSYFPSNKVTEEKFIELLNEYKSQNK
jgi:hypothetical protein